MYITLHNDFHNTWHRIRATPVSETPGEVTIVLSDSQARRAHDALCDPSECVCSDRTGVRGLQYTDEPAERLVHVIGPDAPDRDHWLGHRL